MTDNNPPEAGHPAPVAGELLPCPFCGGPAATHEVGEWNDPLTWLSGCASEECPFEGYVGTFATEAEAIAAWNRRAAITTLAAEAGHPVPVAGVAVFDRYGLRELSRMTGVDKSMLSRMKAGTWPGFTPVSKIKSVTGECICCGSALAPAPQDTVALVDRLVEALEMARVWLNYEGKYDLLGIDVALAAASAWKEGK